MKKRARDPEVRRVGLAGIGFEFAAAVAAFLALGLWIDHRYKTRPWGLVVCVSLGVVGGMYNLICQALQATRNRAGKSNESPLNGDESEL
jgi:F0F1-type ATP synthase assembly protein I